LQLLLQLSSSHCLFKVIRAPKYFPIELCLGFASSVKKMCECGCQASPVSATIIDSVNPLNAELNPICYLLALLGAHHFFHVSRIRVKYKKRAPMET